MSQQKDSVANEILRRYCHEINLSRQQPSYRERCQSTPPQRDIVVASPRILPFPYHNDSMFLPTAEQIQYQNTHTSVVSSSTSRADSSSILPESEYLTSRPQLATNISNRSLSSLQQPSERRSLPAILDYGRNIVISKSNKQQRFLRRSSSFGSNSTLSELPQQDDIKKPWLKRILKFFNKNKKVREPSINEGSVHQVWYCQYSKNPSTRFEKYYHHQNQMVSVS
ncbi:hypothetical protein INT48_001085 [Thamnidium elegans]|uniref:Uncharacterized protein n=1 Tax=Thamnidium elegans TaxID=101142 RepID=A0A8H7VSK3_9FUNG|nr:hypothetical protein INT48_001085 [Thamnidium elegans]